MLELKCEKKIQKHPIYTPIIKLPHKLILFIIIFVQEYIGIQYEQAIYC